MDDRMRIGLLTGCAIEEGGSKRQPEVKYLPLTPIDVSVSRPFSSFDVLKPKAFPYSV